MYKSNYIFVWSLCIRRTRLPRQSSTTTTAGFGSCQCLNMCKIHSHVAHRLAQRTLFPLQCPYQQSAALLHFHPTTFEHFPVLEDRTQQLNSWEFWGVWHLDWQQRTSKLFPASLPTPCQAVALIKGGPNYAHFYAIRGISFHRHGLFFFLCNRQNIQKNAPLFVIPIRPQMLRQNVNSGHAAAVRVRSNIVGDIGFWFLCNIYC